MSTLAGWLLGISGSIAARVLIALGIGWVSYNGISYAIEQVRGYIANAWGAAPDTLTGVMSMAGFGEAIGIILAALTVRATIYGMAKLAKIQQ